MPKEKSIIGYDYGAPQTRIPGETGYYAPYVTTAYNDCTTDVEELPFFKGKEADALEIARKRYQEVIDQIPALIAAE